MNLFGTRRLVCCFRAAAAPRQFWAKSIQLWMVFLLCVCSWRSQVSIVCAQRALPHACHTRDNTIQSFLSMFFVIWWHKAPFSLSVKNTAALCCSDFYHHSHFCQFLTRKQKTTKSFGPLFFFFWMEVDENYSRKLMKSAKRDEVIWGEWGQRHPHQEITKH